MATMFVTRKLLFQMPIIDNAHINDRCITTLIRN